MAPAWRMMICIGQRSTEHGAFPLDEALSLLMVTLLHFANPLLWYQEPTIFLKDIASFERCWVCSFWVLGFSCLIFSLVFVSISSSPQVPGQLGEMHERRAIFFPSWLLSVVFVNGHMSILKNMWKGWMRINFLLPLVHVLGKGVICV